MPMALVMAATESETHRALPIPAEVYGVIALGVFAALLAITWAFRSVATRH
jgi:hypothetical protein